MICVKGEVECALDPNLVVAALARGWDSKILRMNLVKTINRINLVEVTE